MKTIGIDLHGVIDKDLEFFKIILGIMMKSSVVYIISGPPMKDLVEELEFLGIKQGYHFNGVLSIVDFLKAIDVKMWQDKNGRWWANEEEWWSSKAKICQGIGVDVMIDDKEEYNKYFDGTGVKFILYK